MPKGVHFLHPRKKVRRLYNGLPNPSKNRRRQNHSKRNYPSLKNRLKPPLRFLGPSLYGYRYYESCHTHRHNIQN